MKDIQDQIKLVVNQIQRVEFVLDTLYKGAQRRNMVDRIDGPCWRLANQTHARLLERLERLEASADVCACCHEGITDCLCL
jgi:hypothetical protein